MADIINVIGVDTSDRFITYTYNSLPLKYDDSKIMYKSNEKKYVVTHYINMATYYSPSFFVEGVEDSNLNLLLEIIRTPVNNQFMYNTKFSHYIMDNKHTFVDIPIGIYKLTSLEYPEWSKIIDFSKTMIKGEIIGNVSVYVCNPVKNSLFYVKCFRSDDNHYVGEYPVNKDGSYLIPSLDCNTYYTLILYDKNKNMEQQVLSYRLPTAIN